MNGELEVLPVRVLHGKLPILGYRIESLAYITDMKQMAEEDVALLEGVKVLVVNALRYKPDHHAHQNVDDAVAFARRVGARQTWLIHSCHDIGLHAEVNSQLPPDIQLAYDGQVVEIED